MEIQSFLNSPAMKEVGPQIGSPQWNDLMFSKYPTPSKGLVGILKWYLAAIICRLIRKYGKYGTCQHFSLIEVGCEAGYLLSYLSKKFPKARLTGIDISRSALDRAKERINRNIHLFYHDITEKPPQFSTGPFDVIVCSETLEHIPEIEKAINNLGALAGANTTIITTVPDQNSVNFAKRILRKMKLFNFILPGLAPATSEWHVHSFKKNNIECLLSRTFEIIHYKRSPFHHIFVMKKFSSPAMPNANQLEKGIFMEVQSK